jgi:hypothetical protein
MMGCGTAGLSASETPAVSDTVKSTALMVEDM